jgi:hypothetical protein
MRSTPFAFIQSVSAAAHQPSTTVGIGEMVRLSAGDLVGAALLVDSCCVHLAAFRNQAFEDQDRDQARPKARMTRSSARALDVMGVAQTHDLAGSNCATPDPNEEKTGA